MEKAGEELIERYAKLVPEALYDLPPFDRRQIHQTLQVSVSVPKESKVSIKLPLLAEEEDFCRNETVSCYRL